MENIQYNKINDYELKGDFYNETIYGQRLSS